MWAMEVTLGESLTISGRCAGGLGAGHQVLQRAGIGAEGHAAGMDVGTGDIQFVGRDASA